MNHASPYLSLPSAHFLMRVDWLCNTVHHAQSWSNSAQHGRILSRRNRYRTSRIYILLFSHCANLILCVSNVRGACQACCPCSSETKVVFGYSSLVDHQCDYSLGRHVVHIIAKQINCPTGNKQGKREQHTNSSDPCLKISVQCPTRSPARQGSRSQPGQATQRRFRRSPLNLACRSIPRESGINQGSDYVVHAAAHPVGQVSTLEDGNAEPRY